MTKNLYPHLLFVYGTLQKDHGNNRVLIGESGKDGSLLGNATTMPKFFMTGGGFPRVAKNVLGDFPASVQRLEYQGQVGGEVWAVNDAAMKRCDRLESHPVFYRREVIPVTLDKCRTKLRPWMYIIVEPFRAYECLEKNRQGVLRWESTYRRLNEMHESLKP